MNLIEVSKIIIPSNRQRTTFDGKKISDLADSIKRVGLLQPIVLRNDGETLVCGENRLKAISEVEAYFHDGQLVQKAFIPYVRLSDLSPEKLFEAELEENIRRTDLTWQERAKAQAQLHEFRTKQNPTQTIAATAEEVHELPKGSLKKGGRQITEISTSLLLSKYLDDPMIAACSTKADAIRAIKRSENWNERATKVEALKEDSSEHVLHTSSCYESNIENFFDIILTDPPYGRNMHLKTSFDGDKHDYDDSEEAFKEVIAKLPGLCWKSTKEKAHVFVFCDISKWDDLFCAFEVAGFDCWPRPLIWDKGSAGSFGDAEFGFRYAYDAILFARKGDKKVINYRKDIFHVQQRQDNLHPAGKPEALFEEILRVSSMPGDRVGDYFCGSGTIFPAAHRQQLVAYGWEINPKYQEFSKVRIKELGK